MFYLSITNECRAARIHRQMNARNLDKNIENRIRHIDLWAEVNQSIVLNCSLRVNKDQHVNSKKFYKFYENSFFK